MSFKNWYYKLRNWQFLSVWIELRWSDIFKGLHVVCKCKQTGVTGSRDFKANFHQIWSMDCNGVLGSFKGCIYQCIKAVGVKIESIISSQVKSSQIYLGKNMNKKKKQHEHKNTRCPHSLFYLGWHHKVKNLFPWWSL